MATASLGPCTPLPSSMPASPSHVCQRPLDARQNFGRVNSSDFLPRYFSQGATGGYRHPRIRSSTLRKKADHPHAGFASTTHMAILLDGTPGSRSGPTKIEMHRMLTLRGRKPDSVGKLPPPPLRLFPLIAFHKTKLRVPRLAP